MSGWRVLYLRNLIFPWINSSFFHYTALIVCSCNVTCNRRLLTAILQKLLTQIFLIIPFLFLNYKLLQFLLNLLLLIRIILLCDDLRRIKNMLLVNCYDLRCISYLCCCWRLSSCMVLEFPMNVIDCLDLTCWWYFVYALWFWSLNPRFVVLWPVDVVVIFSSWVAVWVFIEDTTSNTFTLHHICNSINISIILRVIIIFSRIFMECCQFVLVVFWIG